MNRLACIGGLQNYTDFRYHFCCLLKKRLELGTVPGEVVLPCYQDLLCYQFEVVQVDFGLAVVHFGEGPEWNKVLLGDCFTRNI